MNSSTETAAAFAVGLLLALAALAVWSSWVLRKHSDEGQVCTDCQDRAPIAGRRYCLPCRQVRIDANKAQVEAAIDRGEW